ncbi:GyrI-like domain-containing protein [Paenibacillus sp. HWE-109]|uniref:GyrI-like domain-containing protein n=1 Tax=Paenibacillus sp. HWE-109 TaxID=1306526 RepID=UPI001EE1282B|nr:GyrI-like domain-containing protein [Paenibacillus sp. HWE-109]UKS26797.1 GyrI-like domain-containing protein [Paenibacillus sp. HWE-109]
MDKLDLAKTYKSYYSAPTKPQIVEFDPIRYVSIQGQGDPDGTTFSNAVEALYTLSYSIKGIYKKEGKDFTVAKLEGLWWVDGDVSKALDVPREEWHWKLLIRMPDYVRTESFGEALAIAMDKKRELEVISSIHYETLHEGTCVQMLHVGPYATEPESLEQLEHYLAEHKYRITGLHHEIYLSDQRKVEPSRMKTILRYPIAAIEVVQV